jgi:phage nucleotide-binding protein
MKIVKSDDPQAKPKIIMLVYGNGGVGKTTFASTAPKPLLVDCENGAKYFGLRGIKMDVAKIGSWSDMEGLFDIAKSGEYETIIIDPIGELMEKLKRYMVMKGDKKLVQADGSPSMAGWGWLKDTMRSTIKILRDSDVNLLLIAHVSEDKDEEKLVKRPMIMTKISDEIVNMVDVVGYMQVIQMDGEDKRIIMVDPASDKYVAKDRTGQLGKIIPPDFTDIIDACQGTKTFKWSNAEGKKTDDSQEEGEAPSNTEESVNDKVSKAGAKKKPATKKGAKTPKVDEEEGEDLK